MKLDVIFTDYVAYRTYDSDVLATDGIGGTEGTVVRLSQALSLMGLKVGVLQHCRETMSIDGLVWMLTPNELDKVKADTHVMLRGTSQSHLFPDAKKIAFMHDVADARIVPWREKAIKENILFVGVSAWHRANLEEFLHDKTSHVNPRVTYIYNPVQDSLFVPKNLEVKYHKNKMIWAASPHKGLTEGLKVFERVREIIPDMELHVFNPGYFRSNHIYPRGVYNRGSIANQKQLWQELSESLCLFYPTNFKETFGLIAAEANAVHCPVATNAVAGLTETVSSQKQLSSPNDFAAVVKNVEQWYNGYRPKVWGQDRFRLSNVAKQWYDLITGDKT